MKAPSDRDRATGYGFALLAALGASGAYLFAAEAVARVEPLVLGVGEFVMVLPVVFLWAWKAGTLRDVPKLSRRLWARLVLQGVFTFGAIYSLWVGLMLVTPTTASLLGRVEVIFTVILGMLIFRERHSWLEGLGGLIAFVGVLVMRWDAPPELGQGSLWILASALCFAGGEMTAKWLAPDLSPSLFVLVRTPMMAVMFLVAVVIDSITRGRLPAMPGAMGWLMVGGVALTGPLLARSFYFAALRRIAISRAALVNQAQPLFVALLVLLVYQQAPSAREGLGGALVLGGTVLLMATRLFQRPDTDEEIVPDADVVS